MQSVWTRFCWSGCEVKCIRQGTRTLIALIHVTIRVNFVGRWRFTSYAFRYKSCSGGFITSCKTFIKQAGGKNFIHFYILQTINHNIRIIPYHPHHNKLVSALHYCFAFMLRYSIKSMIILASSKFLPS